MNAPEVTIVHRPDRSCYEVRLDGEPAGFARYVRRPGVLDFVHTQVEPRFNGQGLGTRLAAAALDDVRAGGGGVIASCPFIAAFIGRHPEYSDLVRDDR